jgi:tetratricopeptide (TPR) repeat protein
MLSSERPNGVARHLERAGLGAQSYRVGRVARLSVCLLAPILACRLASAEETSFWDLVRDPSEANAGRALDEALALRVPMVDFRLGSLGPREFMRARAYDAAVALELKGGEALGDPDILYFLGSSLIYADRGRDEDGRRILRKALAADPGSPLAAGAWFDVAVASNRLLDFQAEHAAYGEALHVQWDEDKRATILSNRAESSMALGDLRTAKDDYLTALEVATSSGSDVYALAAWGLAVAYARDDDLPDALKYAGKATQIRFPTIDPTKGLVSIYAIDLPSVFFTPEHEIFYYRALGEMAEAEQAGDAVKRKSALSHAIELWDQYLAGAKKNGDRWVQNAEYQRRWCTRRLAELGVKQPSEQGAKEGSGSRSRHPRPARAPD